MGILRYENQYGSLIEGNPQFVQNTNFNFEKEIAQLRKMFYKIPMNSESLLGYFAKFFTMKCCLTFYLF